MTQVDWNLGLKVCLGLSKGFKVEGLGLRLGIFDSIPSCLSLQIPVQFPWPCGNRISFKVWVHR